jgi:hypothetical protein
VINLGFSGSGIMDPGVVSFLATIDASLIVIDCSWNMSPGEITARAPVLVAYLRSHGHATTPIVFVEGTTGGQQWISNSSLPGTSGVIGGIDEPANRVALRAAFAAIVAKTPADKNLHLVDGDSLFHHSKGGTERAWEPTYEDPTVGGVHPTDLGHTRMSEFFQVFLPPLLKTSDDARTAAVQTVGGTSVLMGAGNDDGAPEEEQQQAQGQQQEQTQEEQLGLSRLTQPQEAIEQEEAAPPARKPGYTYADLRTLGVHGRAFNDTAPGQYYSRLPAAAKADVTTAVWGLSLDSTNQYVRFTTDAPSVHFTYQTQHACKGMWHMPTAGTCFLDLFAWDDHVASWRHVGVSARCP